MLQNECLVSGAVLQEASWTPDRPRSAAFREGDVSLTNAFKILLHLFDEDQAVQLLGSGRGEGPRSVQVPKHKMRALFYLHRFLIFASLGSLKGTHW